jgi:26S proteasome regulatory subunit N1
VLLRDGHYNLFHLALAMYPRILCTLDTDLKSVSTAVRVGQAVDVVAQAGAFALA